MKFDFGKYGPKNFPPDGVNIAFVNSDYLQYLMRQDWFVDRDDDLVVAIEKELKYRDEQNCHFARDKVFPKNNKKEEIVNMNDEQFVPAGQGQGVPVTQPAVTPEVVPQPPPMSLELKASAEVARASMDTRVSEILQLSTKLRQLQQFKKILNQQQLDQAINAFNVAKDKLKELDSIRHEYVDLPTMIVKLINQFFKSIRDDLDRSKTHLGKIIAKKAEEDRAEEQKKQEEAARKLEAGELVTVEKDGVETVVFDQEQVTPPPGGVVTSSRGASVKTKQDIVVEIKDLQEFLKTCVSKNKRNTWLSENVEKILEVKLFPLKQLIKDNKKTAVPGLIIRKEGKVV